MNDPEPKQRERLLLGSESLAFGWGGMPGGSPEEPGMTRAGVHGFGGWVARLLGETGCGEAGFGG